MTVYLVVRDEFEEGRNVIGVFDNILKADELVKNQDGVSWSNYYIEEWEVE